MSLIKAVLNIAGAVFFLEGSRTILYFLILCFFRCDLTCLRYFEFVLITGASKIVDLILSKVFPSKVH